MNDLRQAPQAQPPAPSVDIFYLFNHYKRLLWRWKWFIVGVFFPVLAGTFFIITKVMPTIPEGEVTILIGMDQTTPSKSIDMPDFSQPTGTKIEIIRSRGFLTDIVKKLSLQLTVHDHQRFSVFDTCVVDSAALTGSYELELDQSDRNSYTITFSNKGMGIKGRVVSKGKISSSDEIRFLGTTLHLAPGYAGSPHSVEFSIQPIRFAVEALQKSMTIIPPEPRQNRLHMSVSITGEDYDLITRTINTMADAYIERNLSIRNRRGRGASEVLEKQLSIAAEQLAASENALRNFLNVHPRVALSMQAQQSISELMSLQASSFEAENLIVDANKLQAQYNGAVDDLARQQAINEILLFLAMRSNTRAAILTRDFNLIIQERNTLDQAYAPDHPVAVKKRADLEAEMEKIGSQAIQTLAEFLKRSQQQKDSKSAAANSVTQQMSALPNLERQLADLQGRQQIDSQLYSSILVRLNETNVANAVEVADVYVMDYAVPPLPTSRLLILVKLFGMAFAAALAMAIGPVIGYDYFDPTARSEKEAQKKTSLPIIAGILKIGVTGKKRPGKKDLARGDSTSRPPRKIDLSMLPTISKGPDFSGEQFRSLATKLNLLMHENTQKNVIVTSLNANEGKSTIAANLAVSMAQSGLRTILIDGDMRCGMLHEYLDLHQQPGLSECLDDKELFIPESFKIFIQKGPVEKLYVIGCGSHVAQPQEMFASEKAKSLATYLAKEFDVVIIDTPPLGVATDAVAVQDFAGRYLIVALAGKTNIAELQREIFKFPSIRKSMLGIVLNMADMDSLKQLNYYHYYSSNFYEGEFKINS